MTGAAPQDFPIGRTIWPSIASRSSTVDEQIQQNIRALVSEFAEYVAFDLNQRGFNRFLFPLFRPFNAVFALTKENLLCAGSLLSGGIAMLRFLDFREESPPATLHELLRDVETELGWISPFGFDLPADLLDSPTGEKSAQLRREASKLVDQLLNEYQQLQNWVEMKPIFRTQPEDIQLDDSLVFVLMPFSTPFTRLYSDIIEPLIRDSGFRALRADQIFSPTPIVEDVWTHIAASRLIIADVTGKNPNVFYELGLAHAVGKKVIIITQSRDDVPFDIAYIRYFQYADNASGWEQLKSNLKSAIIAASQE
jgi:hypothetical protein